MSINQQPVIILVEPQMGANIGMCARAMLNCGLEELRLVNPREGWPNAAAIAAAADADRVLEKVTVFETLTDALKDCNRIFATTARDRTLSIPVLPANEAAAEVVKSAAGGDRVAVLFGPEASGLDNDAIAAADTLMRFPTNPEFSSLNLAQAVLLFGWEWRAVVPEGTEMVASETVKREELDQFLERLELALDEKGFFLTPDMKPHSLRTLRAIFSKTRPTPKELKFLHGMLTALQKES